MKAQYVVNVNDNGTIDVNRVKPGNLPLDTQGKVDFIIVGYESPGQVAASLADDIYKQFVG